MSTIRAAWYERCGPAREVLRLGELPIAPPGPNEVRVRVAVSGVNPHDVKRRSGWSGRPPPAPRVVPHSDAAGVVEAVGPGVPPSRIGERVWMFHCGYDRVGEGAAAEACLVPAEKAVRLPDGVPLDVGACLGVPALTAHRAVFADGPVAGRTILATGGAGAVAGYAIQFARWGGARVIATVSSAEKAAVARDFGADATVDYRAEDVVERVLEWTGGRGVDRIVEVDFGADIDACHRLIARNGVIAAYSSSRVREPVLPYYAFAAKGASLRFLQGMALEGEALAAAIRDVTALLARGTLRHRIAATYPLAEVAAAHEAVERGDVVGKVLVAS
jgi:NADPH2:quinone reductase